LFDYSPMTAMGKWKIIGGHISLLILLLY
jgi:hypothetical protein